MTATATALSLRGRRLVWIVLGAGVALRLVIAFTSGTGLVDHESEELVRGVVTNDPLDLYTGTEEDRWPYAPGFIPLLLGAHLADELTGSGLFPPLRVISTIADVGIALLVQQMLAWRGASERTRIAAVAAIALGPIFIGVSGYHAQIDSVAILPALAGFALWERDVPRRALWAGLLIGAGAAVKTVPGVLLLALLPWCRSPREAATLVTAAAAVPLALLAPYLVHDAGEVMGHLSYRGFPGLGGLSLVVQPELALFPLSGNGFDPNPVTDLLLDHGGALAVLALLGTAGLLFRFRPPPVEAAVVICLVLWVFGVNFFLQYAIWGLPFLVVAGHVRRAIQIQLIATPALVVYYFEVSSDSAVWALYVVPVIGLWALFVAMLAGRVRGYAAA